MNIAEELTKAERSQLAGQFAKALADTASGERDLLRTHRYDSPFVERLITNGNAMEDETLP